MSEMPRWFKDFCCVMGFLLDTHPWQVDYDARLIIAYKKYKDEHLKHIELVNKRIEEIG